MPTGARALPPPAVVTDLRVAGRADEPLGVDDPAPRLGWRVTEAPDGWAQAAYHVRAAGSVAALTEGPLLWDSGRVESVAQHDIPWGGAPLPARQPVVWQVRAWSTRGDPTAWSRTASWETGLLTEADWGEARWIEHPDRRPEDPLPLLARAFTLPGERAARVVDARLYLCGLGLHHAELNGEPVTDEVLAPGNSHYQLSAEYRVHDVTRLLRPGANTLGVALGHGTALVTRSLTHEATGRMAPYSWWESELPSQGALLTDAPAGASRVTLTGLTGRLHVGGALHVDTGDGGERVETREVVEITTRESGHTAVSLTPPLHRPHPAGAAVSGSGNPLAGTEPTANAAVSPRLIARLEITLADGSTETVVTDRAWRAALGPTVTTGWYTGTDHDARREQPGWSAPAADLTAGARRRDGTTVGWVRAGLAPPPGLTTRLVWRAAEPVEVVDRLAPVRVTRPRPGVWVFDFGENLAGWPLLRLPDGVPAGTTVTLRPAESLAADGTVDQGSVMGGGPERGTDVFATYTTHGEPGGESWHPRFDYFGMQWVQLTGLPEDFEATADTVTALRLRAAAPGAGGLHTSDERINRVHRLAGRSVASNLMSTFTDCPGREKLAYLADYTQPFHSLARHFGFAAYLRTMQRHLVEGQSLTGANRGNVALKAPVYDWGYLGEFGDEINWGNAVVLVPWLHYETYGETELMERHYERMRAFVRYVREEKAGTGARAHLVNAPLADWIAADETTSGLLTGTWGYHQTVDRMARMAALLGHTADAREYRALATEIGEAFHAAFYHREWGRYTSAGGIGGTEGATQAAQALALDEGLVPEGERPRVVDALVELVNSYRPFGGGPHLSAGTIGLAPLVRSLTEAGRDDLLWEALQQDTRPGYGHFLTPTTANPEGLTTLPEQWDLANSKNHVILLPIVEWFHRSLAGIRQQPGSAGFRELLVEPRLVGSLSRVSGRYRTPYGEVVSEWTRDATTFHLRVRIPPNTTAEIRVPTAGAGRVSHHVASGSHTFTTRLTSTPDDWSGR
ncbi:alpha-L-rhamnosidase [Streptomyces sedi]|uniref:alpha-L-rhamnosidase n=1 Tax=Streptomyces sedi TaxID=555059 RepID=A0A5C4UR77_9ACTN|nr:alpha-L-rhamnosidase [Streptomyces sedi]TNM25783.1 alpha-galactosidase [Streptomyces sedi]